jgi:hypothetical protein
MRADYDSQGDTIQIELETTSRIDYGEDVENGSVIVSICDGRPVIVDVIGTNFDIEQPLMVAAERFHLDAQALIAAAWAARAAPDRAVTVNVGGRAAA